MEGRLIADVDPDLLAFLKAKVNTFIKWDLVRFFHANPHTVDTADNIARYAGRDPSAIAEELAELAEAGVLLAQPVGGMPVYTLTDDRGARDLIERFVAAAEDRQFRFGAIHYYIIRAAKA